MRLAGDTRECGTCKSYTCTCPKGREDPIAREIRRAGQGFLVLFVLGVIVGLLYQLIKEWPATLATIAIVGGCWLIGFFIDACWPWWKDKK